uniref:Uncharacterized protein n=1 Tax=Romanomermis culicivorax TaxID=13658 RepID=A0A915L2Q3_ROMCU
MEDVLSDFCSFNKFLRRKYLKNVADETTILSLNSALNENVLLVDEEPDSVKTTSEKEISRSTTDNIDTNNENLKLGQSVSEILRNLDPNFSVVFDKDDTIRYIKNDVDNRNSIAKSRGRR